MLSCLTLLSAAAAVIASFAAMISAWHWRAASRVSIVLRGRGSSRRAPRPDRAGRDGKGNRSYLAAGLASAGGGRRGAWPGLSTPPGPGPACGRALQLIDRVQRFADVRRACMQGGGVFSVL